MAKELRTAQELSDMIVSSLGKGEIEIQICKDHAYGSRRFDRRSEASRRNRKSIARSVRPPGMTSGVAINHWPANHGHAFVPIPTSASVGTLSCGS